MADHSPVTKPSHDNLVEAPEKPSTQSSEVKQEASDPEYPTPRRGLRFWLVFIPLCLGTFLAAIDSTIISAALPFITTQLNSGSSYVWIINAYLLVKCAFLPLWGQFASAFGRRWPSMIAVAFFILGSGIAAGANSTAMMLAGRAIQGFGGGGITILGNLIITDLVPPKEVPTFTGYLFATLLFGFAIGPFLGGAIVQQTSWRWVFYINLPIGGVLLLLQFIFLQIKYTAKQTVREKMKRVDYMGNALIAASATSILIALSWGGVQYAWTSAQVLVPLIVGFVGFFGAMCHEAWAPWVVEPTIHTVIFRNYSTVINLILAFTQYMLSVWIVYFLPVYFQAVLFKSTEIAGALLLPVVCLPLSMAVLSGRFISRYGRYKVFHVTGFSILMIGFGLFTIFDRNTSLAVVIICTCVWALGLGQLMTSTLPGIQSTVDPSIRGPAVSTWGFFREFGGVWGISIPAAIFNSRFEELAYERISDAGVRNEFVTGTGFSHASADLIQSVPQPFRDQIVGIYTDCLRLTFYVALGFSALGIILAVAQKEYPIPKATQSEHVLKGRGEKVDLEAAGGEASISRS